MLAQANVEAFQSSLRGELIEPGDPAYEEARKVYNGTIDRRPRFIVRCVDSADVASAVIFARETDLALAVRGGGHSAPGFGTCDDGLVLDLSRMKGIRVDPAKGTVRVQGGCTWGDVDHATHAYGLATPGGIISTTGVAGLSLGGGIGYLTRKYGLSCDNYLSADVVTAEGQFVTASEDENSDLFWALRGGGGNFGVVTSFEFKAHPVSTVFAGPILYSLDNATEAMRVFRDFMKDAPQEMNAFFAFLIVPPGDPFPEELHNKTVCGVVCCYVGPVDAAERTVKPLKDVGPPLFELVGPMPFPALQTMFDPLLPPGMQHYWKADFVNGLSDPVIAGHVKHGPGVPTVNSAMHIYSVGGAAHRPGKNDSAWSYRDADFVHVIAAIHEDPADTPKYRDWVRAYWEELHPHSAGGAYVNFLGDDEGEDRVAASYRDNYEKLAAIKAKYDPTNLFNMNQNIRPAAKAA